MCELQSVRRTDHFQKEITHFHCLTFFQRISELPARSEDLKEDGLTQTSPDLGWLTRHVFHLTSGLVRRARALGA